MILRHLALLVAGVLVGAAAGAVHAGGAGEAECDYPWRFTPTIDCFIYVKLHAHDVNHDGHTDVIYECSGSLVVYLGRGDGSFDEGPGVVGEGSGLVIEDVTGDGVADYISVLGSTLDPLTVVVHVGDEAGTFMTRIESEVADSGGLVSILAGGHLDGDEHLDLITREPGERALLILSGQGDGTFSIATTVELSAIPSTIGTGDLDGDGDVDIVVGHGDNEGVTALWNDGAGGFTPIQTIHSPRRTEDLEIADLDGDGRDDIVTGHQFSGGGSNAITVLLSRPDRQFQFGGGLPEGVGSVLVVLHDIDHDDALDLIMPSYGSSGIQVARGNGDGTFGPTVETITSGLALSEPVVADLDGDGYDDLAAVTWVVDGLATIPGVASGGFRSFTWNIVDLELDGSIDLIDMNGDTIDDLVVTSTTEDQIRILHGDASGGFEFATTFDEVLALTPPVIADFNGDGFADVLVPQMHSAVIRFFAGSASGTFVEGTGVPVAAVPWSLAVTHITDNGTADLIVWCPEAGGALFVLEGQGDATFTELTSIPDYLAHEDPRLIDLNGDGKRDLVSHQPSEDRFLINLFEDGAFGKMQELRFAFGSGPYLVDDFNDDGVPDLMSFSSSSIVPFEGNGDGTFKRHPRVPHPGMADLVAGDANGDGITDLIAATENFDILHGDGAFDFVHASTHFGQEPVQMRVRNQSPDGLVDVVARTANFNRLSMLTSDCSGTTACPADLDGSGSVDFNDLLAVLGAWGTDGADVTGDGFTDFDDVVAIIAAWGAC